MKRRGFLGICLALLATPWHKLLPAAKAAEVVITKEAIFVEHGIALRKQFLVWRRKGEGPHPWIAMNRGLPRTNEEVEVGIYYGGADSMKWIVKDDCLLVNGGTVRVIWFGRSHA